MTNVQQLTWHSYGKNAMLISFRVLIFLAAQDLHNSLNSSSGQTIENCKHAQNSYSVHFKFDW